MGKAGPIDISPELWEALYTLAEESYPDECCGMLTAFKQAPGTLYLKRCKNVYDDHHAKDPVAYPRSARTAYLIDPRELFQIQKENRESGREVKVIYHSHVNVGAYFSAEDKRVATFEGEPVFPGVAYVVISCRDGRSDGAALFEWDAEKKDFLEVKRYDRAKR